MIQRILVPIDLSDYANTTLQYAASLAKFIGAEQLHAIHVYTPETPAGALSIPPIANMMTERENRLASFVKKQADKLGITISHELCLGFAADEIVEQSKHFNLLVMGSQGENDLIEEVFGSVSSTVAQRSHCPTILVPKQAVFKNYEHIVYASNSLSLSKRAVMRLLQFNTLFHAHIHFLHILEEDEDEANKNPLSTETMQALLEEETEKDLSYEIALIEADSVHQGIKKYLAEHPIDLSIIVTKKRGFWARIFQRSATKQLALHPLTPLMVWHLEV